MPQVKAFKYHYRSAICAPALQPLQKCSREEYFKQYSLMGMIPSTRVKLCSLHLNTFYIFLFVNK